MVDRDEYLKNKLKEQLDIVEKEMKVAYTQYHETQTKGDIRPRIIEGISHAIGYWEGVQAICNFVLKLNEMNHHEFQEYLKEQEKMYLLVKQMEDVKNENLKNYINDVEKKKIKEE